MSYKSKRVRFDLKLSSQNTLGALSLGEKEMLLSDGTDCVTPLNWFKAVLPLITQAYRCEVDSNKLFPSERS